MPHSHGTPLALLPRVEVLAVNDLPPLEHDPQVRVVDLARDALEQRQVGRAAAALPRVSEHRDMRPALRCRHQYNARLKVRDPESHEGRLARAVVVR
jgi:hypothetical protein